MSQTGRRWHLSRGGVINIWEYGRETFDFSGGRVIFQGTNGSGKSRTLELLAPLCLDGDLRQMGSKGYDTVSMRRLMLDDYSGESTRIGYAWLELARPDQSGGTEYLTCGIGVKASRTSGQITDSWRFLTPRRIEHNVDLAPEDMPLGPAGLRDALGADAVLDDEEFRAKVAEAVYVIPAARYGDLLHLQRTLRNPDIGVKVFDGHLENILSDALPPLDPSIVDQLATSFEDLHSIQDNLRQLQAADDALRGFLGAYASYAAAALQEIGQRWSRAAGSHTRSRREEENLSARIEELAAAEEAATERVTVAEARIDELDQLISDLKGLPEFAGLNDLAHQHTLVDSAAAGARAALTDSARARAAQQRTADSVRRALQRIAEDLSGAAGRAEQVQAAFERIGLDSALLPDIPTAPDPKLSTVDVDVRLDLEAELERVSVQVPPTIDFDGLAEQITAAAGAIEAASGTVRQQAALAGTLHDRAAETDRAAAALKALQDSAAAADADAAESVRAAERAGEELQTAAERWHEAARGWSGDDDVPELPDPAAVVADADAPRRARSEVDAWAATVRQRLHAQLHAATERVKALEAELSTVAGELAGLRSGVEPEPDVPTTERDASAGTPFYRLVDFAADIDDAAAAGLEAALSASGLLTAWITADGTLSDPDLADVIALAGDAAEATQPSLAAVLVPAREPDCPVSESVIARLLARIGLDSLEKDAGDSGLVVSTSGRWQAGALRGTQRKETAEFIGAGARSAARTRRIAEYDERASELRDAIESAGAERTQAAENVAKWEQRLAEFPDHTPLVAAHTRSVDAAQRVEQLAERAGRLSDDHQAGADRLSALRSALARDAAEAGLPADSAALASARDAAGSAAREATELRSTLQRACLAAVADLRARCADHAAADRDREAAEAEAQRRYAEHLVAQAALAELTEAVGEGAAELGTRLQALEGEQRRLRRSLPELRQGAGGATRERITAEAQREAKSDAVQAAAEAETVAATAFSAARQAPGVWSAAVAEEMPDDHAAALRLLPKTADGSEGAVLAGLQALQAQLPATYTVAPERHGDVLTVTVSGEDGRLPVAAAGAAVAAKLAECSAQLGERYQDILSVYLINDLSVSLSTQIGVAEDLYRRMNAVLDTARSSQGVHVQLQWGPASDLDESMVQALRIIRTPVAQRSAADEQVLRTVFTARIEAERESAADSYLGILTRALDYRSWFEFTVIVRDFDGDGKPRTRRFRNLSSGETRLISYVTLFAAAAAFYDALADTAGLDTQPLRLTLLDEAFERIDDPTIARMLGLLVDLDMDWIITWPSGWGISPKIPRMHIYDVLRPEKGRGIACAHTIWDGSGLSER